MGAGQSTWNISDNVHDPIGDIESSLYNRLPKLNPCKLVLPCDDEPHSGSTAASTASHSTASGTPSETPSRLPSLTRLPMVSPMCNNIDYMFSSPKILDHLLPFLMGTSLLNCMACSTLYFTSAVHWMREKCKRLDAQFEELYGDILAIDKSTLKFEPVYIAERAVRMDWVIYAKVLKPCANRTTHIGYSFAYVEPATKCSSNAGSSSSVRGKPSEKRSSGTDGAGSDRSTGSSSDHHSRVSDTTSTGEDIPVARHPNVTSMTASLNSRRHDLKGKNINFSSRSIGSGHIFPNSIVAPLNSSYEGGRGAPRYYEVNFQFDVYKQGACRELWVHKDICRFHGDETKVAEMCSVGAVCVDDRIEVAVNLLNAFGLVNWDSIRWNPSCSVSLSYVSKVARQCPIEATYKDWFDMDKFQSMTTERLRHSGTDKRVKYF
eukprot:GHVQ01013226.1.p1 GENE.GHVQ01013226.1~~GHVQ01013226.1.p1  ORF type:complete len:434 (+),score=37.24 GHVQ01013226.1:306-1607(+)